MLEDIHASPELLRTSVTDPSQSSGSQPEVRLLMRKSAPDDILPALYSFLERHCPGIPAERLERDLLLPLKKAVGNAHKRGNLRDPHKHISVEVVVTRTGIFFEVDDEGSGFDVAATLALFREGGDYFTHHGSGFRKFTKARSLISFDRNGSTFLLRFLREDSRTPPH
jgi:hypothetical protein